MYIYSNIIYTTVLYYLDTVKPYSTSSCQALAIIHESTAAVSKSDQSTVLATPNLGESAVIFLAIAVLVLVIIVITLATSMCMILFICWKRNHKNTTHTVQHPVINMDINLEQNICYDTHLQGDFQENE